MNEVYEIVEHSARKWPEKPALIDQFGSLTYASLLEQVEALRKRFRELGVRPGHGVGVMGRNSRGFLMSCFAAVGCGAVVMPISHRWKKAELEEMLEAAPLDAIIDDRSGVTPIEEEGSLAPIPDTPLKMRLAWTGARREGDFAGFVDSPAFVRFTSGTTGRSKGVVLSHQTIMERTEAANRGLQLGPDDRVLWVLPMAYHFFVSIVLYIRYGCTIVLSPDSHPETILEQTNQRGATMLYAMPLHYRMLAADDSGLRFETLRTAISTATGLPEDTARAFEKRFGLPLSQAYGIIEVGIPIMNLDHAADRPDSVGKALPGYRVEMLDDALRPAPEGEAGQLAIRGPGLFAGYLNPPQPLSDVLRDGWFLTGDLAKRDDEGLITIIGRSKAMINVAGSKVFPEEIEAVLDHHPAVYRSHAMGQPHPRMGEVVYAEVVLKSDAEDVSPADLERYCRERLSPLKTPREIVFVDEIRENLSGKVLRH